VCHELKVGHCELLEILLTLKEKPCLAYNFKVLGVVSSNFGIMYLTDTLVYLNRISSLSRTYM